MTTIRIILHGKAAGDAGVRTAVHTRGGSTWTTSWTRKAPSMALFSLHRWITQRRYFQIELLLQQSESVESKEHRHVEAHGSGRGRQVKGG